MARAARSSSSWHSGPFMARKRPPTFTKGRHISHRSPRSATARAVAKSNCSRSEPSCPASSARAWRVVTPSSSNSSATVSSQESRFCSPSNRVRDRVGQRVFSTMPGKPAPVPTSMSLACSRRPQFKRGAQSSMCRVATSKGWVMAVRFITWFCSINKLPYFASLAAASAG